MSFMKKAYQNVTDKLDEISDKDIVILSEIDATRIFYSFYDEDNLLQDNFYFENDFERKSFFNMFEKTNGGKYLISGNSELRTLIVVR